MESCKEIDILEVAVSKGMPEPPALLDDEALENIRKTFDTAGPTRAYAPADPNRPWRDFAIQQGARAFLKNVVWPWWIQEHARLHVNCGDPYVDEWGRLLCRAIHAVAPVDGPWENPTHYLFYAYNNFQTDRIVGIRLRTYLEVYSQP